MAKNNKGLVDYAKQALGLPYWNGTFGQIADEALYRQKKAQLPSQYTASDFPSQYGKVVHDCAGLIKGYFWKESFTSGYVYQSNGLPDINEEGIYNMCREKGSISSMPDVEGMLVFKFSGGRPYHVGVYVGDGYVIEAKGHAYGVVRSRVGEWHMWAKLPIMDYVADTPDESADEKAGKGADNSGNSGKNGNTTRPAFSESVYEWQKSATADGFGFENYGCDGEWGSECEFVAKRALVQQWSDGKYRYPNITKLAQRLMGMPAKECDGYCGPKTTAKIREYQRSVGLSPDGGIGVLTWKKLLGVK